MQDEIDRLRALIGPDERSYAELVSQLTAASDDAKAREHELGDLRARVVLLERAVHRAERRNAGIAQAQRIVRGVRRRLLRLVGRSGG